MIMKFSRNKKLNEVLSDIYDSLLSICDTEEESRNEVKRYMREFPHERDFNLYQYGNMRIYNHEIRDLYKNYASLKKKSDWQLQEIYKQQIGFVCRNYF